MLLVSILHFNSHAHVERDALQENYIKNKKHFNSHAHVERDGDFTFMGTYGNISTHTLTWSVTHDTMCYNIDTVISTHTLTWSVTVTLHLWEHMETFQLTRSRGA